MWSMSITRVVACFGVLACLHGGAAQAAGSADDAESYYAQVLVAMNARIVIRRCIR
jgi:hypothetical protein